MKRTLITLAFFSALNTKFFGQTRNLNENQILKYKTMASNYEEGNQFEAALQWYYFIAQRDSISDSKGFINNKIEIIFPKVKKITIEKLKGKWKLIQNVEKDSTNLNFTEYIEFNVKDIIFYDKSKRIKKEKLIIEPFIYKLSYDYPALKIGQNESWILNFREINGEKRLIFEKRMDKNQQIWGMIDDRGIIKNPEKRKKALETEIHTYYKKIE